MSREARLRQLLGAYVCHPEGERDDLDRMRRLLDQGERALSRDHFEPGHFTASAFVVAPDRDALLLILHQKLGLWLQPGGHVEPNDPDLEAAARREVAEEVGLSDLERIHPGIFDIDIHDIPALGSAPPHQHFDVRFLFRAREGTLTPSSDALDARWTPFDAVARAQSDESVMRALRRLQTQL
jgi:8-oxo-dGTP pyrophosphatase MutT (NUDIX family)